MFLQNILMIFYDFFSNFEKMIKFKINNNIFINK